MLLFVKRKVLSFFLNVRKLKSVRRMSDGSEFHADGHDIANDRDPKAVFEAGTQSSPDDADLRPIYM